ncbi:MAG: hypothetical protein JW814_04070 [Candidatus Krumholzibacteriota bacterium]|nr:hypothetical protein [Candidatus Krumholzibacteriota bacterium]
MEDARDLVDQTVLVRLDSTEGLEFTGIEKDCPFFCKVSAVDEIGIWVENRKFVTIELKDSGGKCIPVNKQKEEINTVNFLLPWRKVLTVVKFPDIDPEKLENETVGSLDGSDRRIGFLK